MDSNIQKLLTCIEERLDWGAGDSWQSRDFEQLSELIFEQTRVRLSESTLKRVWGKVNYQSLPSTTTLDALAKFAGFEHWRSFLKKQTTAPPQKAPINKKKPMKLRPVLVVGLLVVVGVITVVIAAKRRGTKLDESKYSFSCKRLSESIPGSVLFTYNASDANDSVFIQYKWDEGRKTSVDKNGHTFTVIQYEPGFHHPQLLVGKQVVKTIDLIIPTNGWLGWIADGSVPVYLDSAAYLHSDKIEFPVARLIEKDPASERRPPFVHYFNVGNFGSVPVTRFSFSAQVKSSFNSGAAACQFILVQLVTDGEPIKIPISAKGCVSDLILFSFDKRISGRNTDLSSFGTDPSSWVTISCQNTAKTIRYFVDGHLAFESPLPTVETKIVGIGFSFQGTGAVRQIKLMEGGKNVFKDF